MQSHTATAVYASLHAVAYLLACDTKGWDGESRDGEGEDITACLGLSHVAC